MYTSFKILSEFLLIMLETGTLFSIIILTVKCLKTVFFPTSFKLHRFIKKKIGA